MATLGQRAVSPTRYAAYRIGRFTLDIERKVLLTAEGVEAPLRPKSFSMLLLLAKNAGRTLSSDTIMNSVWPGLFVTENNITQCVHEIRNALGAEGQQILRTRPRHGYQIAIDVVAIPSADDFKTEIEVVDCPKAIPPNAFRVAATSTAGERGDGIAQLTAMSSADRDGHHESATGPGGRPNAMLNVVANRQFLPFNDGVEIQVGPLLTASKNANWPRPPDDLPGKDCRLDGPRPARGADRASAAVVSVIDGKGDQPAALGAPRLSLVVLPFVNLSDDPKEEYFVDGITECLTTDVSRIRGAFVIARNTAFTYKGKALDTKTIGRELNVRYVLEGSVQRVGRRMRVSVQLVDAESGHHLWAERFDKPVADFFELQDEISARLASQLGGALIAAEARRSERAPNPDALDLYLQGMAWINMGPYPAHLSQARALFDRALSIEPDNVDALVGSGCADFWEVADWSSAERGRRLLSAEASLSKALASAPDNALAHLLLSAVKTYSNRPAQGIVEAERALALDPNLAPAWTTIGLAKHFVGHPEETEHYVRQALRLSPRDRLTFIWLGIVGASKLHVGRYEDATTWLMQSVAINPNFASTRFLLAAAFAQMDRIQEARAEALAALALNPRFTIDRFRANPDCDTADFLKQRHNVYEGLRKAQVPET